MCRLQTLPDRVDTDWWISEPLTQTARGTFIYELYDSTGKLKKDLIYKEYRDADKPTNMIDRLISLHTLMKGDLIDFNMLEASPLNIVVDPATGHYGVVMEKVDGVPLRSYSQLPSLPISKRLEMASHLAYEFAKLDSMGIVHTDLTSANILCRDSPYDSPIAIIDVDLVAIRVGDGWKPGFEPITSPGLGSPYVAPEQLSDDNPAEPSIYTDRWALAVAIHHLLLTPHFLTVIDGQPNILQYAPGNAAFTGPHQWPSVYNKDEPAYVTRHRKALMSLGQKVAVGLVVAFDQTYGFTPEQRWSGQQWRERLESALS